jgi:hypothetical protein
MKTTFGGSSLMPHENQASVGRPLRRALFIGFGVVNGQRTNRIKEL